MRKALSDMTLEELWELFPIFLTEHREIWNTWYAEERQRLAGILPPEHMAHITVSHIGSTAINGIRAKPIIDILMEIPAELSMERIKTLLLQAGYLCMSEQPGRKSFNRGYTSEGFAEKVFHLHLRYEGDNDELYFRDYLNENPSLAKQYEELKLSLWKTFEHDRDGYTLAKTGFVTEQTEKAKTHYGDRYRQREITITPFPISKTGLPAVLESHHISVNEYAGIYMRHPAFQTEEAQPPFKVVLCALRELGLKNGGRYADIFTKAGERGLSPCRPCTGLFLRLSYPEQAQSRNSVLSGTHRAPEGAVTVLSEFLEKDDSFPKGLYLRNVDGTLWLRGYLCDETYHWSPEDVFAFEKRP